MRRILLATTILIALAVLPALGQTLSTPDAPYRLDFDPDRDLRRVPGEGFRIQVNFSITRLAEGNADAGMTYKVIVEEEGQRVAEKDVDRPTPNEDLRVVLAMDTSGSMSQSDRMDQARAAATDFFKKLPAKAECGLILFDHEMRATLRPSLSRAPLQKAISAAEPRGGTAYLDACAKAIDLLSASRSKS